MRRRLFLLFFLAMVARCTPVFHSSEPATDAAVLPEVIPVPLVHALGFVRQHGSQEPVPDAFIRFANSDFSARCEKSGFFMIDGIPVGNYVGIISIEGHQPIFKNIEIREDREAVHLDVRGEELVPVDAFDSVQEEIRSLREEIRTLRKQLAERAEEIELFRTFIVGASPECVWMNPEALEFRMTTHPHGRRVEYTAMEPLRIENRKLGYRLFVILEDAVLTHFGLRYAILYDAVVSFEKMTPSTSKEIIAWRRNREQVYEGSLRHFLSSLAMNHLRQDDYLVCKPGGRSYSVSSLTEFGAQHSGMLPLENPYEIMGTTDVRGEYLLNIEGQVEVVQERAMGAKSLYLNCLASEKRKSTLSLPQGAIRFDRYGRQLDFKKILVSGYWATTQLSELLPDTYFPGG